MFYIYHLQFASCKFKLYDFRNARILHVIKLWFEIMNYLLYSSFYFCIFSIVKSIESMRAHSGLWNSLLLIHICWIFSFWYQRWVKNEIPMYKNPWFSSSFKQEGWSLADIWARCARFISLSVLNIMLKFRCLLHYMFWFKIYNLFGFLTILQWDMMSVF